MKHKCWHYCRQSDSRGNHSAVLLLFFLSAFLQAQFSHAAEVNLSRSVLVQLALSVAEQDVTQQYQFSKIALLAMYESYQYEIERALTQQAPDSAKKRLKLKHWLMSAENYLDTLNSYLFQLDSGAPIHFFVNKQDKIFILIGSLPVIVSGPNAGADKQIQSSIVEQYCLQYDCQMMFNDEHRAETDNAPLIFSADSENSGEWQLTTDRQARYVMTNGLVFYFSNIKNRAHKELWAMTIATDANLISAFLQRIAAQGKTIYWQQLQLRELPVTDKRSKIIINHHNDFIKVALVQLDKQSELFIQLIPWLKNRITEQAFQQFNIKNSDKYLP